MARWRARASGVVARLPDGVDPGAGWERLDGPQDAPAPAPAEGPRPAPDAEEPDGRAAPSTEPPARDAAAPPPTAAEVRRALGEAGLKWRRGWTKADAMAALEGVATDG